MDVCLPMLARSVVKSDDDNLAHDPFQEQRNKAAQAQNL